MRSPTESARRGVTLAVLAAAAALTALGLLAIAGLSAQASITPTPPQPVEIAAAGQWAGWWLDDGWQPDNSGALNGDTRPFPAQPLDAQYMRYAFPPLRAATGGDYRLRFDLTLAQGTLYVGVRANWHPSSQNRSDCGSLVFPLREPLAAQVFDRAGCQMRGVRYPAAKLAPPYSAALRSGQPQQITITAQGESVQLVTLDTVIWDVTTGRASGGPYFGLGPGAVVQLTNLSWEAVE